ncbi:MAG: DsrE family protein [Gammaproteobacteria bacterium]
MKSTYLVPLLAVSLTVSVGMFTAKAEPLDKTPLVSKDLYHPPRVTKVPKPSDERPFAEHFVIFHISSGDAFAQKMVLANAQNLQNFYGPDKVQVEVVAYGPGLRILFRESTLAERIQRMANGGIEFSACGATMQAMGRPIASIHKAAKVVPGGVVRITELQEAGWTYIRP